MEEDHAGQQKCDLINTGGEEQGPRGVRLLRATFGGRDARPAKAEVSGGQGAVTD